MGYHGSVLLSRSAPRDPLQVQHGDRIQNRHQPKRDESRYAQSADLGVAEWLPERPAMTSQGEESQHGCGNGDHHRAQTLDSGVKQGLLQRSAVLPALFDEVEEHDDVANDDADQRDHAEESHEPERRAHQPQGGNRARHAVRDSGEDQ